MQTFGRFTVQQKLGQGGMGVVYEVHDPEAQAVRALKLLPEMEGLNDLAEARFVREFALLSRLSHPNLIQVYESGLHEGIPFYTMERLDGVTLAEYARTLDLPDADLWGQRNQDVFNILFSLLDAIEYMHRRGIMHRDVQPGNVMILADGTPKLMDFGLARQVSSESRLTRDGTIMGTVRYCAPEQVMDSATVDARADLYSLGVILYELAAGQPPFTGNLTSLIHQILSSPVPPPKQFNPRLADDMVSLLAHLLEKDRTARFQSAAKLRRALAEVALARRVSVPAPRADSREPIGVAGENVLFAPGYVAPEAARSRAEEFLAHLAGGNNGFFMVHGEEGLGKSRFAAYLALRAQSCGLQVMHAACDAEGASPYHAVVPILQQACRSAPVEELQARFGQGAALLSRFLSRDTGPSVPSTGNPVADRLRLFDVVSRVLRDTARKHPAILIVDDIQWADLDSFELLSYVVRDQAYQPGLGTPGLGIVWLCEGGADPSFLERISRLVSGHAFTELTLAPLAEPEFVELVASILGDPEGAASVTPVIYREIGGNPGFAVEVLKSLVESGALLERNGVWGLSGTWQTLPLTLGDAYGRRLLGLSGAALDILRIAALLGVEWNYQELKACAPRVDAEVLHGIDELMTHGILRQVPGRRRGQFAFASPQLRHYVVQHLDPEERHRLHGQILRGLSGAYEKGDRRVLHALAAHARQAGDSARALDYTLLAAVAAAHGAANQRAADLYEQAAALPGFERKLTPSLREAIFDVFMAAGRHVQAHDLALDAAHHETDPPLRAHWLHRVGRALMGQGKNDDALHCFEASLHDFGYKTPHGPALLGSVAIQFLRHLPHLRPIPVSPEPVKDPEATLEALEVMLDLPNLYYFVSMPNRDAFFYNNILRAFNTAQHIHSLDIQTLVYTCYAVMMAMTAHPPASLIRRFLHWVVDRQPDMKRLPLRIEVCRFAGHSFRLLGDLQDAIKLQTTCMRISEEGNNARGLAQGTSMLSFCLWDVGPVDYFYRTAATAVVKCEAVGDRSYVVLARVRQGAALALMERFDEADELHANNIRGLDLEGLHLEPLMVHWGQAFRAHVRRDNALAASLWEDTRRRWLSANVDHIQAHRLGMYAAMAWLRQWHSLSSHAPLLDKIHRWFREAHAISRELHLVHGHVLIVQGQLDILQGHADKGLSHVQHGFAELETCGAALAAVDFHLAVAETLYQVARHTPALRSQADAFLEEAIAGAKSLNATAWLTDAARLQAS